MAVNKASKAKVSVPRLSLAPVARVPFECVGQLRLHEIGNVSWFENPGTPVDVEQREPQVLPSAFSLRGAHSERTG